MGEDMCFQQMVLKQEFLMALSLKRDYAPQLTKIW